MSNRNIHSDLVQRGSKNPRWRHTVDNEIPPPGIVWSFFPRVSLELLFLGIIELLAWVCSGVYSGVVTCIDHPGPEKLELVVLRCSGSEWFMHWYVIRCQCQCPFYRGVPTPTLVISNTPALRISSTDSKPFVCVRMTVGLWLYSSCRYPFQTTSPTARFRLRNAREAVRAIDIVGMLIHTCSSDPVLIPVL